MSNPARCFRPALLLPAVLLAAFALPAVAAAAPGWECIPTTAGQAVLSGGTGSAPSCTAGATPVAAPTYVASGVGGKPTVQFSGVNVQVVSGSGSTAGAVNGKGNLIIGYAEPLSNSKRTGSHNLILGIGQSYSSYGSLLAGLHDISSSHSQLLAGYGNSASGADTSITGGYANKATSAYATVTGGRDNISTGPFAETSGTTLVAVVSSGCGSAYSGSDSTATSIPSPSRCDVAFGDHDLTHCKSGIEPRPSIGYLTTDSSMTSVAGGDLIGISYSNLSKDAVAVTGRHSDGSSIPASQMGEFKLLVHC